MSSFQRKCSSAFKQQNQFNKIFQEQELLISTYICTCLRQKENVHDTRQKGFKGTKNIHLISGWRRRPGAPLGNHRKGVEGNYLWYVGKIATEFLSWYGKNGDCSRKQK